MTLLHIQLHIPALHAGVVPLLLQKHFDIRMEHSRCCSLPHHSQSMPWSFSMASILDIQTQQEMVSAPPLPGNDPCLLIDKSRLATVQSIQ